MSHSRALQHFKQRRSRLKLREHYQDPRTRLMAYALQSFHHALAEKRRRGEPPVIKVTIYTPIEPETNLPGFDAVEREDDYGSP